jgi:hypothetical protein
MSRKIPIQREDTNMEVLARIVKAASRKYECTMEIDFQNGNRKAVFVGNEMYKPHIAREIQRIFGAD